MQKEIVEEVGQVMEHLSCMSQEFESTLFIFQDFKYIVKTCSGLLLRTILKAEFLRETWKFLAPCGGCEIKRQRGGNQGQRQKAGLEAGTKR